MKRFSKFFSLCTIAIFVLSGCASNNLPYNTYTSNNIPLNEESPIVNQSSTDDSINESNTHSDNILLKETCIYDANNIKISTTEAFLDDSCFELGLYIENNSQYNYSFYTSAVAINGIAETHLDQLGDIASGQKANCSIKVDKRTLDKYGIETIKTIDILFYIPYDGYDNATTDLEVEQIQITTNLDDGQQMLFSGTQLYENNNIEIDYLEKNEHGYCYSILNNTGTDIDIDIKNLALNSYTVLDRNFDLTHIVIPNNCQSLFVISESEDFMQKNSIDVVNEIEYTVFVRENNTSWESEKIITTFS